jgi:hypothetical protein
MSQQVLCAKCKQPLTEDNFVKIYNSGADGVVNVELQHKTCAKPKISLDLKDTPNKVAIGKLHFYWEKCLRKTEDMLSAIFGSERK